ncbi:hypothetical protein GJAV_G00004390 [Gymnothorax javanicus]|nr:hypothetical protein GJAV_G00004390 [Gymnothorax javanicus]
MTGVERVILIGCLLQGALGREWAAWMPKNIEALSGSCVQIPCRFEVLQQWEGQLTYCPNSVIGQWFSDGAKVFDSRSNIRSHLKGKITGDLLQKNCTTVLEKVPETYSGQYKFRLECSSLRLTFQQMVELNIKDSPPKPKLTPDKVEVMEGANVSLSCSAAAPCPDLPPNLTWTPRLGGIVDQLQVNEDQTQSVSSVMTFSASHLHHEQKITCRAQYTLQQGGVQKISEASRTLKVFYPPQNTSASSSPSGSVFPGHSVTLTCSSNANPPVQIYTWYKVDGAEMNMIGTGQNLTFNVTESSNCEQYYCEAQNKHGMKNSTTVQLSIIYRPQISGSGSCSRTAAQISCSCESRGNPSPSIDWRVSGLQVTNSTDRVIREEQLGSTGLRSSLTMYHSQGDTPNILCLSTNTLGSSSLQLHIPSPEQHSAMQCTALPYALIAALICLYVITVAFCIHKIRSLSGRLTGGREGDTYASLQLSNISPEYDALQFKK